MGRRGRHEELVCALRHIKTKETVSHGQNNNAKEAGKNTLLITVSTAVWSKTTKTVSKKQLLRTTWLNISLSLKKRPLATGLDWPLA